MLKASSRPFRCFQIHFAISTFATRATVHLGLQQPSRADTAMNKLKKAFRPTDEVMEESVEQADVKHQAGQDPNRDAVTPEAKFARECQRCADAVLHEPSVEHKHKVWYQATLCSLRTARAAQPEKLSWKQACRANRAQLLPWLRAVSVWLHICATVLLVSRFITSTTATYQRPTRFRVRGRARMACMRSPCPSGISGMHCTSHRFLREHGCEVPCSLSFSKSDRLFCLQMVKYVQENPSLAKVRSAACLPPNLHRPHLLKLVPNDAERLGERTACQHAAALAMLCPAPATCTAIGSSARLNFLPALELERTTLCRKSGPPSRAC